MNFRSFILMCSLAAIGGTAHGQYKSGELIVKLSPSLTLTRKAELVRGFGGTIKRDFPGIGWTIVKVPTNVQADVLANSIKGRYGVINAVPNSIGRWEGFQGTQTPPNDPLYGRQYGIPAMRVPAAWRLAPPTTNVRVVVLDSGTGRNHPDLAAALVDARDFSDSPFGAEDQNGHGTHVCGIVAATTNNGIGVAGVARNAKIISGKVGDGAPTSAALISGIMWAADNAATTGAKVIQMSLSVGDSQALKDAVDYAWNKGLIVIDAAGNESVSDLRFPSSYTNCIGVAATNSSNRFASFSNYGSWVDVAAPGEDIMSTYLANGYDLLSGTSMAAPHVSGVAALVWSYAPAGTTNVQVREALETTATPLGNQNGKTVVFGLINAEAALMKINPFLDQVLVPKDASVYSGFAAGGGTTSVISADGLTYSVSSTRVIGLGQVAAAQVTMDMAGTDAKLYSGTLQIRAKGNPAATHQIYLWNYRLGRYDLLKQYALSSTLTNQEVPLPTALADYVSNGDMKVLSRGLLPQRLGSSSFILAVDRVAVAAKVRR
jgi:thermitase